MMVTRHSSPRKRLKLAEPHACQPSPGSNYRIERQAVTRLHFKERSATVETDVKDTKVSINTTPHKAVNTAQGSDMHIRDNRSQTYK